MKTLERKYAKDLKKGDKINGHEAGWITVLEVERTWLKSNIRILLSGDKESKIYDSHTVFEDVITEQ